MDAPFDSAVTAAATARSAMAPAPPNVWRAPLYARLRGRPTPLVWTREALVPGASLWTGARLWVDWFRAHGVTAGDRVVCALPPGPAFVMVLVAALWEGLTFVPVAAPSPAVGTAAVEAALAEVEGRVAVAASEWRDGPGIVACADAGTPPAASSTLRPRTGPATPDVRFLLATSGTSGAPRRVALSDANVWAVLDSHAPHVSYEGATVLSVLPWHHAFGLVIELLPALLAGAELVRDPSGGRDVQSLLAVAAEHPVTHLCAVPLTVRLLAGAADGTALLERLRGGVIGGAPVEGALADVLARTRLRVGYGQTEASPGIMLGVPGVWRAGTLGSPVGCHVRLDGDGMVAFQGANAHLGLWQPADGTPDGPRLATLPPERWVRTGDLARQEPDGTYTFEGRLADSFKLENGRFVAALAVERAVRARWPVVTDALLSSPDGRTLVLAVSSAPGEEPDVGGEALAQVLGPLVEREVRVVRVPESAWVRTPKGELDRRHPVGRPVPV